MPPAHPPAGARARADKHHQAWAPRPPFTHPLPAIPGRARIRQLVLAGFPGRTPPPPLLGIWSAHPRAQRACVQSLQVPSTHLPMTPSRFRPRSFRNQTRMGFEFLRGGPKCLDSPRKSARCLGEVGGHLGIKFSWSLVAEVTN